jgi:dolichol-phosphate mannosyltransferase
MNRPIVSLIIPCFNEVDGIAQLISRLCAMREAGQMDRWEVLFVDDGSKDGTGAALDYLAEEIEWVRVVHHTENRGLGASIRTGFAHADGSVLCTMDSDCTFSPESLPQMVGILQEGADIVTASPWHPESEQGTVHPVRKLLSRGASAIYRMILGQSIHSFTPMHRAYRREVVKRVRFESNNFSAVAELLVNAIFQGFRVRELPMRLERRKYGESKIDIAGSILSHLSLMKLALGITLTDTMGQWVGGAKLAVEE